MAAEPATRLTQLPGFDTAPDVYETPDHDDDTTTSTVPTTSSPADSSTSDTSDEEDYGVSRRRLYPERARSRFGQEARSIKTRGADLSDRVDGRRRGFRSGGREEEGLEARIARLRREVEECKVLAEREKGEEEEVEGESVDEVETLSRLLAGIEVPAAKNKRPASQIFHDALPDTTHGQEDDASVEDDATLTKITTFDSRLAALETALGISSLLTGESIETPLLPTLTLLDSQLATLNSATSLATLESASSRIQKLKSEAEDLTRLQLQTGDTDDDEEVESTLLSPDDMQKLQSLYTLLPTLQSLAPTVPALVARLRSLRTLHTSAANASADLDSVEKRQGEMDRELKMWREGLEKVEQAVKQANEANGRNGNFVKEWVEDLEKRMGTLGR